MSNDVSLASIRAFVLAWLGPKVASLNVTVDEIEPDVSLTGAGLISSQGFIELVTEVEEHFGIEVSFAESDPSQFTTIDGFAESVMRGLAS